MTHPGHGSHEHHHAHPAAHQPVASDSAARGGHTTAETHEAHDKHAGHSPAMFRDLFWLSAALTIPTVIWSDVPQQLVGYRPPVFPGSQYVPTVFGTAVYLYGGRVFLAGAVRELRDRLPGMMTLISLAITVAFGFSVAVAFGFHGMALWWELATLVSIMLLGHWMEMRSIQQASGALKELARLLPRTATRVIDGGTEEVTLDQLRVGDVVLVRPGQSIPVDGVVREGRSAVNESMITGESRPVDKKDGNAVIGGTVNGNGSLRVQVTKVGEQTALAGIMRLVQQAQSSRSRAQALADRAAFWLTLIALGSAIATLVAWMAIGAEPAFIAERVVTVLVIACPHALGLAIPLVVAISTTLGARSGLLVRDRRGLEEARELTTVVFDKTGTLTLGQQRVVEVVPATTVSADDALRLTAAIEGDSEHPIARAVVASAKERGLAIPPVRDFRYSPGEGVEGTVEGRKLRSGGPNLLRAAGITPSGELAQAGERMAAQGQSAIHLIEGSRILAVFGIADAVRPESKEAVERLHKMGIRVAMLTGDARAVAQAVASQLGIDTVFAEVLPDQKSTTIRQLQQDGQKVAMVGDGVNDAPALLSADVGIAIGAGTDVAVEAGDVVLVRNDPRDVPRIIRLSRSTYRKMIQNLWWAAGYNIVAIPLAAGVLARQGIVLHPALGAVFMSLSTIIVALNAQLLRRARL